MNRGFMNAVPGSSPQPISLRLPASSANLGPGFDTLALALDLYLEIDAQGAEEFSIEASGRNPEICGQLEGNLLLATYRQTWLRHALGEPVPLALTMRNGIPLGMGCGSSAASHLAGVALASYFGGLDWSRQRMLDEVAALEHHPDNAAACCLGGFVVAGFASCFATGFASSSDGTAPSTVLASSIAPAPGWRALLVLPEKPLATTVSRAVLPTSYARETVVGNLQNLAVLVAALTQGDGRVLVEATRDQMHQPYRGQVCPLLPRLLPLAGRSGILSVTLSGAGSGVLLLLENETFIPAAEVAVRAAAEDPEQGALPIQELICCAPARTPARLF